jgi:GT2 family glycosyltransferase/glycosyltransferase involved in cell wall biosynthesis
LNILFVSYGGFDCNSGPFIAAYADALSQSGLSVAVAVANRSAGDMQDLCHLSFFATDHVEASAGRLFPDGRPADIVHAWTPRENVRRFCVRYAHRYRSRIIVHMEDNEEHILSIVAGKRFSSLLADDEISLAEMLPQHVSHPRRYRLFLDYADAATLVWPSLADFLPSSLPSMHLPVCAVLPDQAPKMSADLRSKIALSENEKVLVYSGGINRINLPDQRLLYEAVVLLNQQGIKCRLLRTGPATEGSAESIWPGSSQFVSELGLLPQSDLLSVMNLADAFVQPGTDDEFNRYRLPCKIPEFLAIGCPAILAKSNFASLLRDGEDALILKEGTAGEIARQCAKVFGDAELAKRLAASAKKLSREHFDLSAHSQKLLEFYAQTMNRGPRGEDDGKEVFSESVFLGDVLEKALARDDFKATDRVRQQLRHEHPPRKIRSQLYWASESEGFSEDRSENLCFKPGGIQTLEFTKPGACPAKSPVSLRLDPINVTGEFRIQRIEAIGLVDGRSLKVWRASDLEVSQQAIPLDLARGSFLATASKPSLLLGTLQPPHGSTWKIVVEIITGAEMGLLSLLTGSSNPGETPRHRPLLLERICRAMQRFLGPLVQHLDSVYWLMRNAGGPVAFARLAATSVGRYGVGGVLRAAALTVSGQRERLGRLPYEIWIRRFDSMDDRSRRRMQEEIARWNDAPLISIVMPVYNTPISFLQAALDSVMRQIYPNWELCVADDASTDKKVRKLLDNYRAKDPRIKVDFLRSNCGISGASNAALQLAAGEWIALLDHDDVLAEHALFMVARTVTRNPGLMLVYSDEDKLGKDGRRCGPYFKPDWNPALFRSHNLITHLGVYRAKLVRQLGGFRAGYDGAQDYDLALRFVEQIAPEQIHHIPHILYHWRIHAASTADITANAKPYAMLNGEKALNDHLARTGARAKADLIGHGFRITYDTGSSAPLASLVIATRDRFDLLERCISSIKAKTWYRNYEIIVVDNASSDGHTLAYLERLASTGVARIVRDGGDFNFSRLNNAGVRAASGEVVVLMNNDLEVIDGDWLREMVSLAIQPDTGAVGAKLLFPGGHVQHAGVVTGICGYAGHAHKGFPDSSPGYNGRLSLVSEFSAVTGACLAVRKSLFEQAGGLDEINFKVACNDVDFCLRLRKMGFRNLYSPHAKLYHHESASRGYEDTPEKKARFRSELAVMEERWGQQIHQDPFYNPNLTLAKEDFDLAWPPRTRVL